MGLTYAWDKIGRLIGLKVLSPKLDPGTLEVGPVSGGGCLVPTE